MIIGAMNDPQKDLYEQIEFIAENFDFLDLTIEPGESYAEDIDTDKLKKVIKKHKLKVVGHTPWNLPIASPFKPVREAAYNEFVKCLEVFSKINVNLVNVHPFMPRDMADPNEIIDQNITFFKRIVKKARKYNAKIMMENTKGIFNEVEIIAKILKEVPQMKLHWDVGHANLGNEGEKKTQMIFENFKKRIAHVHMSDNNGAEDQHLPMGTGNINWAYIIKTLKDNKYDGTITLEIHSPDPSYLLFSRDKINFLLKNVPKDGDDDK